MYSITYCMNVTITLHIKHKMYLEIYTDFEHKYEFNMHQFVHSIKLIVFGYLIYNEDKILRAFLYFICALPYVQFNKYLIRALEKSRLYFHFSWLQCDNTIKFYLVLRVRQVLQSTCNLTFDIFQMVSIILLQIIFHHLFTAYIHMPIL